MTSKVKPSKVSMLPDGIREIEFADGLSEKQCEEILDIIAAAPETAAERDRLKEVNKELLESLKEVFYYSEHRLGTGDIAKRARQAIKAASEGRAQ